MNTLTIDQKQVAITRKITKVAIQSHGGIKVSFEKIVEIPEDDSDDIREMFGDDSSNCKSLPHPDFTLIFDLLRSHYAILTNQLGKKKVGNISDLDDDGDFISSFVVTGFTVNHDPQKKGCKLHGSNNTEFGVISPDTPFINFDSSRYKHLDLLINLIERGMEEALLYMDGKLIPSAQTEIDFDNPDANEGF